jgi:hypothetical protein
LWLSIKRFSLKRSHFLGIHSVRITLALEHKDTALVSRFNHISWNAKFRNPAIKLLALELGA